jgi:hypothetical protein
LEVDLFVVSLLGLLQFVSALRVHEVQCTLEVGILTMALLEILLVLIMAVLVSILFIQVVSLIVQLL